MKAFLDDFRDIHIDGTVVICATGKSAEVMREFHDIHYRMIQTIGVNAFEWMYDLTPFYSVFSDKIDMPVETDEHYAKHKAILNNYSMYSFTHNDNDFRFSMPVGYRFQDVKSDDLDKMLNRNLLPSCVTTTEIAIGLALYMGFKNIGIIGFDLYDYIAHTHSEIINQGCDIFQEHAKRKGVNIWNLSEHSAVTSFPYIPFNEFVDNWGADKNGD